MDRDKKLISTPLMDILVECDMGIPKDMGMSLSPMREYIMQSVFLRMTGALEQKLKCIIWRISVDDYSLRYEIMHRWDYGECSSYKDKNKVLAKIYECIDKLDASATFLTNNDTRRFITDIFTDCDRVFDKSEISNWFPRQYNEYKDIKFNILKAKDEYKIEKNWVLPKDKMLYKVYDALYNYRNRCAHNLHLYHKDKTMFSYLSDDNYVYENWFLWFAVLLYLDRIYREVYTLYENYNNK